jgi:hypothetical protein
MRLRAHRRNLVVWSSGVRPVGHHRAPTFIRARRTGRMRRLVRIGALLTVIGLNRLVRVIRPRWKPVLAGLALTVAGLMMHGSAWEEVLLPGLLLLMSAPLIPARPDDGHRRLERELAAYSTHAERSDLEAILDQYPDAVTHELRGILSGQAETARRSGIPGAGPSPARRWTF